MSVGLYCRTLVSTVGVSDQASARVLCEEKLELWQTGVSCYANIELRRIEGSMLRREGDQSRILFQPSCPRPLHTGARGVSHAMSAPVTRPLRLPRAPLGLSRAPVALVHLSHLWTAAQEAPTLAPLSTNCLCTTPPPTDRHYPA